MEIRAKKRMQQRETKSISAEQAQAAEHMLWHWPQTVLVPVDLSACPPRSLHSAATFASELGARLIVLHVRDYDITGSWAIDLARTAVSAATDVDNQFNALIEREIPPDLPFEKLLITGAPAQRIVQVALQEKADLIILASHCRTGLAHARLGSVTEQVIRSAPCPVLVFPMRTTVDAGTPDG